jgi:MFS transporter, SP family, general alpha glucoside:H+ symporter
MSQQYGVHEAPSDVLVADNAKIASKMDAHMVADAAKADAQEHKMTLMEAFQTHKRAIFWSMALSAA